MTQSGFLQYLKFQINTLFCAGMFGQENQQLSFVHKQAKGKVYSHGICRGGGGGGGKGEFVCPSVNSWCA